MAGNQRFLPSGDATDHERVPHFAFRQRDGHGGVYQLLAGEFGNRMQAEGHMNLVGINAAAASAAPTTIPITQPDRTPIQNISGWSPAASAPAGRPASALAGA